MTEDTIFAPSTALGGAIAVIRVSGPDAKRCGMMLERMSFDSPGTMRFCHVMDGDECIDDAMAVYFAAPKSYTGEETVEINCHGGYRTVQRVLETLGKLGFRPAEGGEFTRRAFLNGKMDLSQAEAVMDIITADAERSRKAALNQLHGSVSREVGAIESKLFDALSGIDAAIDYPDEAEEDCLTMLPETLSFSLRETERLISEGRRGRVLRDGLRVVILGRPNVGKSSLMNALSGCYRAIVTDVAGTTRDIIDESLSFDGVPVRLIDTAGIHDTGDTVERIGVDRAMEEWKKADVALLVLDSSSPMTPEDESLLLRAKEGIPFLVVLNKCDLTPAFTMENAVKISAVTGEGLDELKKAVLKLAAPQETDAVSITNERHLAALENAAEAVRHAQKAEDLDCAATDIRSALHALGSITGTDVDATVIDRIFERFCVGK